MDINSAWDVQKFEEKKASMKKGAPGCGNGYHAKGCGSSNDEHSSQLESAQDREDYIWNYLENNLPGNDGNNISDLHLSAIMGNIYVETAGSFDPMNAQDGCGWSGSHNPEYIDVYDAYDSVGWGLVQWTFYTRKENLLNYAGSATKVGDMDIQLEYLVYELTQDSYYSLQYQEFLNQTDLSYATQFFCENIEQAGIPHLEERCIAAQNALNDHS